MNKYTLSVDMHFGRHEFKMSLPLDNPDMAENCFKDNVAKPLFEFMNQHEYYDDYEDIYDLYEDTPSEFHQNRYDIYVTTVSDVSKEDYSIYSDNELNLIIKNIINSSENRSEVYQKMLDTFESNIDYFDIEFNLIGSAITLYEDRELLWGRDAIIEDGIENLYKYKAGDIVKMNNGEDIIAVILGSMVPLRECDKPLEWSMGFLYSGYEIKSGKIVYDYPPNSTYNKKYNPTLYEGPIVAGSYLWIVREYALGRFNPANKEDLHFLWDDKICTREGQTEVYDDNSSIKAYLKEKGLR